MVVQRDGEEMTDFRFEKSGNYGILSLAGELTSGCSGRLKEALMVSLENAEHVVVNLKKVTKIDALCVHVFALACRKARQLKKQLILTGIQPEAHTVKRLAALLLPSQGGTRFTNGW